MKTYEKSPIAEVYIPYIEYPDLRAAAQVRLIWEAIGVTPLPLMSRWIIYRALQVF